MNSEQAINLAVQLLEDLDAEVVCKPYDWNADPNSFTLRISDTLADLRSALKP